MSMLFKFLTIRIPINDENNLILSTKTEIIKKMATVLREAYSVK